MERNEGCIALVSYCNGFLLWSLFLQCAGGFQHFEPSRLDFSDPWFYRFKLDHFKVGNVCIEGNKIIKSYGPDTGTTWRLKQPIMAIRSDKVSTLLRFTSPLSM